MVEATAAMVEATAAGVKAGVKVAELTVAGSCIGRCSMSLESTSRKASMRSVEGQSDT